MKLYQIHESDLEALEQALPRLSEALTRNLTPRIKTHLRNVKRILSDVRWNYGPPDEVETIPAGES